MQELALVILYYVGMTNAVIYEERIPYASLDECLKDAAEMNKQPVREYQGRTLRFQAGCSFFVDPELL